MAIPNRETKMKEIMKGISIAMRALVSLGSNVEVS